MEETYNDLAIVLAWPDATIRGDERWMMFFRKIGLVKNLNFKVGHTGIILIDSTSKSLLYYDFGRYISPRGKGRARSPFSDPRLRMRSQAVISDPYAGQIDNLDEIVKELDRMQAATQGEGRLFFGIATGLSFRKAKAYADRLVVEGSTPYGAFARGNNNCSRFITRLLVHASRKYDFFHGIRLPESIKSSPMSNVVNLHKNREIYVYHESLGLHSRQMSRTQSLFFLLGQLRDNFTKNLSALLPDDHIVGSMEQKPRPPVVPETAQWLGGVGEGAWYQVSVSEVPGQVEVARYTESGELEYTLPFQTEGEFAVEQPFTVEYDSHMLFTTVRQAGKVIRLHSALADTAGNLTHIPVLKPANQRGSIPKTAVGYLL